MEAISLEQQVALVRQAQDNPAWFCKTLLRANLWEKQREIITSVKDNRYTSVVACHAPGKTFVAANLSLTFLYTHRPAKVITTAPTARQVYSLLWSEIRTAHSRGSKKYPLGGQPLKTRLELAPDWYAEGFSSSDYDPERVQGYHSQNILIVVDEASGVADGVLDSLESLMSSGNAHMLFIGNPNRASGRFYESFSSPLFNTIRISAYDTPNFTEFGITREDMLDGSWKGKIGDQGIPLPRPYLVTPEWVSERLQVWGPDSQLVRTQVDAKFPTTDSTDNVIPVSYLDTGAQQSFPEDEKTAPVHIGVDIARFGSDESVIAVRAGRQSLFERVLQQRDTMTLVGEVQKIVSEIGPLRV